MHRFRVVSDPAFNFLFTPYKGLVWGVFFIWTVPEAVSSKGFVRHLSFFFVRDTFLPGSLHFSLLPLTFKMY